jgi:mannose-6-phosphate isomerase class I
MLTYKVREPVPLEGKVVNDSIIGYYPPVADFQVEICSVKESLEVPAKAAACVGIVGEGEGAINGQKVVTGSALFVPCGLALKIAGKLQLFLASVNESQLKQ